MSEDFNESFANITGNLLESDATLLDTQYNTSALQGVITALTKFKQAIQATIIRAKNNLYPMTAEPEVLEEGYGTPRGIIKRKATGTIYLCKIITTGAVSINTDDEFTDGIYRQDKTNNTYQVIYKPIMSYIFNKSGEYEISVVCQTKGIITSPIGTLNKILTAKENLQSITNISLIELGTEDESGQEYDARYMQSITTYQGISGTNGAIQQILESDIGGKCIRAVVYDNTGTEILHDYIPAGYVCIVCYGGNQQDILNSLKDRVYGVLFTYGNLGTTIYVSDSYIDKNGIEVATKAYPISWNTAKEQPFKIKIKIVGTTLPDETLFKEKIKQYINVNRICDFLKDIKKNDILLCVLQIYRDDLITDSAVQDVCFVENEEEKNILEPTDCFTIPVVEDVEFEYIN